MKFKDRNYDEDEAYFYFLDELKIDIKSLSDEDLEDYREQLVKDEEYLNYIENKTKKEKNRAKYYAFFYAGLFCISLLVLALTFPALIFASGIPFLGTLINYSTYSMNKTYLQYFVDNRNTLKNKQYKVQEEQHMRCVKNHKAVVVNERLQKYRAKYDYLDVCEEKEEKAKNENFSKLN